MLGGLGKAMKTKDTPAKGRKSEIGLSNRYFNLGVV